MIGLLGTWQWFCSLLSVKLQDMCHYHYLQAREAHGSWASVGLCPGKVKSTIMLRRSWLMTEAMAASSVHYMAACDEKDVKATCLERRGTCPTCIASGARQSSA